MPEATRATTHTVTTSSSAAPASASGRPRTSIRPHRPTAAMMAAVAKEIFQAKRVMKASYLAVSPTRLSSTLPRRSRSRFTS